MTFQPVRFEGKQVWFSSGQKEMEYRVREAFRINEKVIVLYDRSGESRTWGQFPNLFAYDLEGNHLWTADLPSNYSSDTYKEIIFHEILTANSWSSFHARISISTGKVIESLEYERPRGISRLLSMPRTAETNEREIKDLKFQRKTIWLDTGPKELEEWIGDAFILDNIAVVLYNPLFHFRSCAHFRNLAAFDQRGEQLWVAELPTEYPGDRYIRIRSGYPLVVDSWSLFHCTIDPGSGKILQKVSYE